MKITIYNKFYENLDSFENFLDIMYLQQMPYFASDLLQKGFSQKDIQVALERAFLILETAGLNSRKHFKVVYSQLANGIVKDCRMSQLGYALVLLNASPQNKLTAQWQLKILDHFFES